MKFDSVLRHSEVREVLAERSSANTSLTSVQLARLRAGQKRRLLKGIETRSTNG